MDTITKRLHENRQIELAKSILEAHGYKVEKKIDEGIFDSKRKKQEKYENTIKEVFKSPISSIASKVLDAAEEIIQDSAESGIDRHVTVKQIESMLMTAINDIKKNPEGIVSTLIRIGRKYAQESRGTENIEEIMTKVRELQKLDFNAKEYLLAKVGEQVGQRLKTSLSKLKQDARYDK